jgi:adenylate cyclase
MAGVIGTQKFSYDVWGDTVNLASRLESRSQPGRILVCPGCRDRLEHAFTFENRGQIDIKGVGMQETFFVVGEK